MFYVVSYEEGFGLTSDIGRALFMINTRLRVSCRTFFDMDQAYRYACKRYIESHAFYGQQRVFPLPRLESFSAETDMFESPQRVPFTVLPIQRFFSVTAYIGNQGYNAILNGVGELAEFCKADMILSLQESQDSFHAEQWLWQQQMVPIMTMGAYLSSPVFVPIPGVGESVPFNPPNLSDINVLEKGHF